MNNDFASVCLPAKLVNKKDKCVLALEECAKNNNCNKSSTILTATGVPEVAPMAKSEKVEKPENKKNHGSLFFFLVIGSIIFIIIGITVVAASSRYYKREVIYY